MTRAVFRSVALLVVVVGLFAGVVATAAAATPIFVRPGGDDTQCNGTVNVDYSVSAGGNCAVQTVGKGVALVDSGGTVQVAAGSYPESVTVNRPVTLDGAQAGVDARSRTGSESIVNSVSIGASNVIVDGFTFAGTGGQANVSSSTMLSGVAIQNDIFNGYGSVGLPTYNAGNILIQQDLFESPSTIGEAIQIKASNATPGGCDGSQVLNNAFRAATNNGGADVNLSCTGSASSGVTISGNTSSGNGGGSSFVGLSGVGDGITVSNNTATTSGSTVFVFGAVTGSAAITNNVFVNSAGSAVSIHGGDITSDPANTGTFTITSNRLNGNVRAVYVAAGALGTGGGVSAQFNEIVGNSAAGVENASSVLVDATNNWWGCNSGPNTTGCDTTVGSVTADPWLTLSISANPATISPAGLPNDSSAITASLTVDSNGVDTSGSGHVPDGTPVTFATTDGTLSSTSQTTVSGAAGVTLTATSVPGSASVSATVDQQTVSTTVSWQGVASTSAARVLVVNPPVNFWIVANVRTDANGAPSGSVSFADGSVHFSSTSITGVVASGNQATVVGTGRYMSSDGSQDVTFRLDVMANGPYPASTAEIQLSNGYDSGVVPVRRASVEP